MKRSIKTGLVLCILCGFLFAIGWNLLPVNNKTASVPVVSEKVLVPGGQSVGVKMDVRGVLIVGLEEIEMHNGETVNPGILSGLQIGDMILSVNGTDVYRADELQEIINDVKGTVSLKIKRNGEIMNVSIEPVVAAEDGMYKLGVWVKDKTAGIGTLTYYDPSNGSFGALGHGIVDPETNSILSVETGLLLHAQVQEIKQGENGEPGEIKGIFYQSNEPMGSLITNCEYGIFGTAYQPILNDVYNKPLAVGTKEQVETGKAYILTTLGSNKVERYEIEIEKVMDQDAPADKSMIIKATDERLLNESGGIIQGMSGSPIIQNDRIIGAVTHVFVNDPEKGYGLFIEWMLEKSNSVEKSGNLFFEQT